MMKSHLVVLVFVIAILAQMAYSRSVHPSSESVESVEASLETAYELAEIKHDLKMLQKRFNDLGKVTFLNIYNYNLFSRSSSL